MTVATDPRKTGIAAGMTLLAASAVAASVTGTTAETVLATVTIPAGAMGLNGAVLISSTWSHTSSANAKTLRVRHGGIAGTVYLSLAPTSTASSADPGRRIRNRNSTSSQVGSSSATTVFGSSTGTVVTASLDTSAAQDIVLTGQLALNTETITLESYEVWLLP